MNCKIHKNVIADMHTHSESSHDSVCKIEDMYNAQKRAGTDIFAVTDHFDTASFTEYDVFTPIKNAYEKAEKLKEKFSDDGILTGVEISEGFWFPSECEKVLGLVDYDVVIGSVHLVKYKNMTEAYSKIDFSRLDMQTVKSYTEAYFNDMLTMIDTLDFDILAHLTCPLRYINGKYGRGLDISNFDFKIERILQEIIKREIALEVNTSSFNMLNDFMPSERIIGMYRKMGGRLITLGSDAHIAENASANFDKAVKTLKNIGFKNIYFYKKRSPFELEL